MNEKLRRQNLIVEVYERLERYEASDDKVELLNKIEGMSTDQLADMLTIMLLKEASEVD